MGENRGLRAITALVLPALMLSVVGLASCGSDADDAATGHGRTAAVYESILGWVLDQEPGVSPDPQPDEPPDWELFVAARSEGQIDLDVQVAVIAALEPRISIRFIDERSEAVDLGIENEPVRREGLLIGLGAVDDEGDTVEVYVDRYRDAGDVGAWTITVRRSGSTWQIVGSPAPADVRPLPADD